MRSQETPMSSLVKDDGSISVILTGQTGTTSVGSFTFVGKANVTLGSQLGTSALGSTTVDAEANAIVTGLTSTGSLKYCYRFRG